MRLYLINKILADRGNRLQGWVWTERRPHFSLYFLRFLVCRGPALLKPYQVNAERCVSQFPTRYQRILFFYKLRELSFVPFFVKVFFLMSVISCLDKRFVLCCSIDLWNGCKSWSWHFAFSMSIGQVPVKLLILMSPVNDKHFINLHIWAKVFELLHQFLTSIWPT